MWDFEHGNAGREFDISYTLLRPALALCKPGTPTSESSGGGLRTNSGVDGVAWSRHCLAPAGAFHPAGQRVPLEKIRAVALDTSSMTSVALTKILFEKWLGAVEHLLRCPGYRNHAHGARCRAGDWRSGAAD